jgi:dethiobiotin synthetase
MSLPGLLVVGTDTGVGKTRVAGAIAAVCSARGRRVGVLKPGASRLDDHWRCEDAEVLAEAVGGDVPIARVAPMVFEAPLAPCVAARIAGRSLQQAEVEDAARRAIDWWSERADLMIVEGVGGLLCPLAEGTTVADLAVWLDYPMVLVARRGLGTLNHTLLTIEAARFRSLRLAGIVLNSPEPGEEGLAEATNAEELSRRVNEVPILWECRHGDTLTLRAALNQIDWEELASAPRRGPG